MADGVDFCRDLWRESIERGEVAQSTLQDAFVPADDEIAEPRVPEFEPYAHEAIGRICPVSGCICGCAKIDPERQCALLVHGHFRQRG